MPRFMFTRHSSGGLGISDGIDDWLYLWPDEVAKLCRLLDRPTPVATRIEPLGRGVGLQVIAQLSNTGRLRLEILHPSDDLPSVDLDHLAVMQLRDELGLLKPRDNEPSLAVITTTRETFGSASDRMVKIAARAMRARRIAEVREAIRHV